jgi:diketogulonate reductase-like aldo/keto reductase
MGSANSKGNKNNPNLDEELVKVTKMAIDVGYRHIDGAQCKSLSCHMLSATKLRLVF